ETKIQTQMAPPSPPLLHLHTRGGKNSSDIQGNSSQHTTTARTNANTNH
uniref:Uncharacterized protein n=1 Tax=Aegilops tauschii subsp. strangulata TaxID=200361 RepID=A0A453HF07_AEGTS